MFWDFFCLSYEPVSSDSEDEFEVAAGLFEKEETRREAVRVAKTQKRKRSASKKKKSNKKRKKNAAVEAN